MEITYTILYHPDVVKSDIPGFNGAWQKKIKKAIEQKLTTDPTLYGVPLRKNLHGLYKLRVGDFRVIYRIEKTTVYVLVIGHRRDVYGAHFSTRTL